MANAQLLGTLHEIPDEVKEHLVHTYNKLKTSSGVKGLKRLNGLIQKGACTYEQLKRIKNYFDHVDPKNVNEVEYALNGGDIMKSWVNFTLESLRKDIHSKRQTGSLTGYVQTSDVTVDDLNPEKKNKRTVIDTPDLMSSNDLSGGLMEQVSRMRNLIKTI